MAAPPSAGLPPTCRSTTTHGEPPLRPFLSPEAALSPLSYSLLLPPQSLYPFPISLDLPPPWPRHPRRRRHPDGLLPSVSPTPTPFTSPHPFTFHLRLNRRNPPPPNTISSRQPHLRPALLRPPAGQPLQTLISSLSLPSFPPKSPYPNLNRIGAPIPTPTTQFSDSLYLRGTRQAPEPRPLCWPISSVVGPNSDFVRGDEDQVACNREKLDVLLRLGVLKLASGIEVLTVETVPETLELNVVRLRSVQSRLQQIIVISTSLLVLKQILLGENSGLSPSDIHNSIADSLKRLVELLESSPDAGIEDIVDAIIAGSSLEHKLQSRKDMITRVLTKSLQSIDAVFMKVSRSVYLAARAVVLGGGGIKGRQLAEAALRRVGAVLLLDQVVKAAKTLIVVATVSGAVHAPWCRFLA